MSLQFRIFRRNPANYKIEIILPDSTGIIGMRKQMVSSIESTIMSIIYQIPNNPPDSVGIIGIQFRIFRRIPP